MTAPLHPVASDALHALAHLVGFLLLALAVAVASASVERARRVRRPSRRARHEERSPHPPSGSTVPGDPVPVEDETAELWPYTDALGAFLP